MTFGDSSLFQFFRSLARSRITLGLFAGVATFYYFGTLLMFAIAVFTGNLSPNPLDVLDDNVGAFISLCLLALSMFVGFRITRRTSISYPVLIGAASSVGLYCFIVLAVNVFRFINYIGDDSNGGDIPQGFAVIGLGLLLIVPWLSLAAIRRARQRVPLELDVHPSAEALSLHFAEIRRGAATFGAAAGLVWTKVAVAHLVTGAVAGHEAVHDTYTLWSPSDATYFLIAALLLAPLLGFATYRYFLRRGGIVLWLRPFRRPRHIRMDRLIRASCAGIAGGVTLQDSTVNRSLLAGFFSRWVFAVFVLPIWLIGFMLIGIATVAFISSVQSGDGDLSNGSIDTALPIITVVWTCLFLWFGYWYVNRYSVVTLQESTTLPVTGAFLSDLRSGHLFGSGLHILCCPDSCWRNVVALAISRADAVIVDVTLLTDNILWEVSQALERLAPTRVILLYYGIGYRIGLPPSVISNLRMGTRKEVSDCVQLVFDSTAEDRLELQMPGKQLRQVIERLRFERDLSQRHADREIKGSLMDVRGWLRLPIIELFLASINGGLLTLLSVVQLLVLTYGRVDTQVSGEVLKKTELSVWAILSWQMILLPYSIYLIGELRKRRKSFIGMMITWFITRTLLYALFISFLAWEWRPHFDTVGKARYIAGVLLMPAVWFGMSLYMARSHRAQKTFAND
jgi:hypothetical protein